MRFDILGPVRVRDDRRDVRIPAGRQLALLGFLVVHARQVVSTDTIVDALWQGPELPADPTNAVHSLVSRLRRATTPAGGGSPLRRQGSGYVLDVAAAEIDAQRFEQLVADGRREAATGSPAQALAAFDDALLLWRGEALHGVPDAPWSAQEAHRLGELRLAVLEERAEVQLALGRHADALVDLEGLVSTHPFRERLRAALMLALYRSGRQAEALAAFQEGRRVLAEELGIDPGPALRDLHQRILAQSPDLAPAPGRQQGPPVLATDPQAPRGRQPAAPAVIGREQELGALTEAWARTVHDRRGCVALLSGEPGIGKSRLVSAFAHAAAGSPSTVLWGRCLDHDGAPPFWPWIQILRELADELDVAAVEQFLGPGARELANLVPELGIRAPAAAVADRADPAQTRFRLYDAVCKLIARVATSRPLLVILEDLHSADEPSLDLLGVLATGLRPLPVMVVGTYRDGGTAPEEPLRQFLARMAREPVVQRHGLRGLSRDDVCRLLDGRTLVEPAEDLVRVLHERTGGNPFFVTELLALLDDERERGLRGAANILRTIVPDGVRDTIDRRVTLLPPAARDALRAAAVAGHSFRVDVLAGARSQRADELVEALEPAIRAGLVVEDSETAITYRFAHDLVRDAIYLRVPPVDRARTHARLAAALEALHDGRRYADIARHYERAAVLGFARHAVDAALMAAEHAEGMLAFEQAGEHLRSALRVLDSDPDAERELAARARLAGLLLRTGGYGHRAVSELVEQTRRRAAELGAAPEVAGLTWALWVNTCVRADFPGAARIADELVRDGSLTGDPVALAAGQQARGTTLWHLGRIEESATALVRGIEGLARTDPGELRRRGLQHAAVLGRCHTVHPLWLLGRAGEAERHLADATQLARQLGDPYELAFCDLFHAWLATLRHEPDRAWEASQGAIATSEDYGFPLLGALAGCLAGWAQAAAGQPSEGAERIANAIDAVEATGARMLRHFHLGLLADARRMAGRADLAAVSLDQARVAAAVTGESFHMPALDRLAVELADQPHAPPAR